MRTFDTWTYEEADLVGITAFTSNVGRAYEIADEYRNRGIPVVMGGIHASMLPEEALRHVDAVVAGEVEGIWAKVLEDFQAGKMAGVYHGPQVDLETSEVLPRRDSCIPDTSGNRYRPPGVAPLTAVSVQSPGISAGGTARGRPHRYCGNWSPSRAICPLPG
jgi:radical SAM superfamily enzyme YgiQ (UPF0313 family)